MNIFKLGIVITTYNRPEYLKQCLESLSRADIPEVTEILFVDDNSVDETTLLIIQDYCQNNNRCIPYYKRNGRRGISDSLLIGYDFLFERGCEIVTNLDSDALVRNDFLEVITKLKIDHPKNIITGFHSVNKNSNGSDRHPVLSIHEGYCKKGSVGGINFCVDKFLYEKYLRPVLIKCRDHGGNWDHQACLASMADGNEIVCSVPSVVQHIGFDSSMNHTEQPDVASDFKELNLPNVTIIGIDCVDFSRIENAINKSCENINFGSVKILTSLQNNNPLSIKINHISTIEQYSHFVIKELHKYIDTEYALIIQHDGYVLNHKAWSNEFLQYDYIGATWWYKDQMNVGNGGFSLRSKKLIKLVADDNFIKQTHPEDHHICRTYRKYLEGKGIKFAPESIAKKFSIEGHGGQDNKYTDQFGFHGKIVKFSGQKDTLVINQFQGLGDILFSMKAVQDFIKEGHKIIWPTKKEYVNIQKHFPEIEFVDMNTFKMDYNKSIEYYLSEGVKVIPLRYADSICQVKYSDCMKSKYMYFGKDWKTWKGIKFIRDHQSELILFEKILSGNGIKKGEKFNVINKNFRTDMSGVSEIAPDNNLKSIVIQPEKGFTMIDWSLILEHAEHIYTVGTSINYLIEMLDIKAKSINLYVRRPEETDFKNYEYILSKEKPYVYNY